MCKGCHCGVGLYVLDALFNPKTSILIQKRHPYTGNLNSETLGDSRNTFLHWGDVLAPSYVAGVGTVCIVHLHLRSVCNCQTAVLGK